MKEPKDIVDAAADRALGSPALSKMVEEAVTKALSKLEPKALADKIEVKVENAWQKMVFNMLGFENSWNEFRVDHCNGRQSAISDMLKSKAQRGVEEFLKRGSEALDKLPIDEKVIKAMKAEYDEHFSRGLREKIKQRAEADVNALVNDKLAQFLDHYVEPEAEAINALHQAIKTVKDPNVAEMLKKSLAELEQYTLKSLDD